MWDAVGTGWQLVRRVAPGTAWHPATDRLKGTEVYGALPYSNAQTADATFSISFSDTSFTHFLFATGDEQVWLYCTKEAAVGSAATIAVTCEKNGVGQRLDDGSYNPACCGQARTHCDHCECGRQECCADVGTGGATTSASAKSSSRPIA